jgi:DNA primase
LAVGAAAEIKSRLSIVDVVGETVALRKAGTTFKGLCPFHAEKTPSFVVTPARGTYKCFGCGKGGDIFSFVMERDGIGFSEALKLLAGRAGVELDEARGRDDGRRARLREVLETAIAFYHAVLTEHRVGRPALDYLRRRGFTDATIERFQLGWAPAGWDTLSRELGRRRGITADELAAVGLTVSRPGGRGAYDRFRERIIFPIRDASGAPTGLGGRILELGETASTPAGGEAGRGRAGPKYLNTPATPLFDKSRTLYLIDRAKAAIRRTGQAVLVEGYTDALMAHQAGFENVVASLGTALTPGQVAILGRYARRVALAYDVDPAGQSAGAFGISELTALISEVQAAGADFGLTDVGVVRLPEGRDPDEVIRDSPEVWEAAVAAPVGLLEYLVDVNAARVDVRTADGRRRLVEAVLPVLRRVADPTVRDGALLHLARRAATDVEVLREALRSRPAAGRGGGLVEAEHAGARLTLEAVRAASEELHPREIVRAVGPSEVELLRLLLLVPELQLRAAEELGPDQLPSTLARELYRAIVLMRAPNEAGVPGDFDLDRLRADLEPEVRALATAVLALEGPDPRFLAPDRQLYELENLILNLEAEVLAERSEYNRAAQAEAERRGDRAAMIELLAQERQIHEAWRSLHRRREQARLLARRRADVGGPTPAGVG